MSLNNFPKDSRYQTFLVDSQNRVIAIGNPVGNPGILKIYRKWIFKESLGETNEDLSTRVRVNETVVNFETLDYGHPKTMNYVIHNEGKFPLELHQVWVGCNCLKADYEKSPVLPGDSTSIRITHNAESRGVFMKSLSIFCNIEDRVLNVQVKGYVK